MGIRIRLTRMGKKKKPCYRIVVADKDAKRDGRYIEQVGFYDPITDPATIKVNMDRYNYWLSVGAKPTETVVSLVKNFNEVRD